MNRTRTSIACPAAHTYDANHLAMALGLGPDDGKTYHNPSWQDAMGNLYAVASLPVQSEWLTAAQSTLKRPAWDQSDDPYAYTISMAAAERAQAILVFWTPAHGGTAPQADPDSLTAIGGMEGLEALAAMGLTHVPMEEPI